jgi:2-polyprenyl-6-methoxyphenol hydroxylase-like FAD-dependent oxidoreductase
VACQPQDYAFFTRHGQLVYREPWGLAAGHHWPHCSIHRGDLHQALLDAVRERLGPQSFIAGHRCVGVEQGDARVTARFVAPDGSALEPQQGDVLVACDGIHSAVRAQFFPNEGPFAYRGINMWRGVTRHAALPGAASPASARGIRPSSSIPSATISTPPATSSSSWVAEIERDVAVPVDWNKPGRLDDFLPVYRDWRFDWLDVPAMMRNADAIFSYPMVEGPARARWSWARHAPRRRRPSHVSARRQRRRAGDHRRRHLARLVAGETIPPRRSPTKPRLPPTSRIVLQNRSAPPNVIVDTVEQRTGGKRFDKLEDDQCGRATAIFERAIRRSPAIVQQVGRSQGVNPWQIRLLR